MWVPAYIFLKSWQKNIFTEGVAGSETYSADAKLFSGIEKLFTRGYLIECVKNIPAVLLPC